MYTLTTFRSVPQFVAGHVRDLRVRWALEEAGLPYELRLIGFDERDTPAYRRQQPFGQVPLLDDDGFTLFETGAMLLRLGEKYPVLLPQDPVARSHAVMWMFAALNSVEPWVANLSNLLRFSGKEAWAIEHKAAAEEMANRRLRELDVWLEGRDYLCGQFTAADILMTTVLRLLEEEGYVEPFRTLSAYKARCMARPAFKKALADQMALYAPAAATA